MKRSPPAGEPSPGGDGVARAGHDEAGAREDAGAERPATAGSQEAGAERAATAGSQEAGAERAATAGSEDAGAERPATAGSEDAGAERAAAVGAAPADPTGTGVAATTGTVGGEAAAAGGAAGDPTHGAAPPPLLSDPVLGAPPAVAPVVLPAAQPATPAGLDPAEAAARPPAGRRGRLRRRLRYLRRARELMLRDLGGLVYEVHRTGGGDLQAHSGLVGAKLERLVALEAEARRLEIALSAPREQVVLFEPGVGGTCSVCGELFGSDARFCAHCGTPTTGPPDAPPAAEAPASERAPTLAEPDAPEAAPAARLPEPPAKPAAPGAEANTSVLPAAGAAAQEGTGAGSGDDGQDASTDVWRAPPGDDRRGEGQDRTEVLAGEAAAEPDREDPADADGRARNAATDPLWTRENRS